MITLILTLIGAVIGLVASLFIQGSKNKTLQALLNNDATTKQVDQIQGQINNNQQTVQNNNQQIDQAKTDLTKQENQDVSKDDLVDFFNKHTK